MLAARLGAVSRAGPGAGRGQRGGSSPAFLPCCARRRCAATWEPGSPPPWPSRSGLCGGGRARGGARIDIRYELWDEVWLVTRADTSGRTQRARFASFEQLEAWWRDLRLEVLPPAASPGPAEVRLRVIPFSQSEQLDAQRWFSPQPGRAVRRQRRGRLRSPGGALGRSLQPPARHFHRPAGVAGVRVEPGSPSRGRRLELALRRRDPRRDGAGRRRGRSSSSSGSSPRPGSAWACSPR